jgi:type IV pilus assembly protein PilC
MASSKFSALRSRSKTGNGASHSLDKDQLLDPDPSPASELREEIAAVAVAPEPKKLPRQIGRGFKLEDRILFCRQLATFVRSGIPLLHSMGIILGQTKRPVLREAYSSIIAGLQRGEPLSQTMAMRPKVFPRLMVDLVEASQRTGRLDVVLAELAQHYERDLAIRRRIRQAMTYPALVFALAIFVVVILVVFVMPAFVKLFDEFAAELPLTARMLLSVSKFLTNNWYLVILGIAAVVMLLLFASKRSRGKRVLHRVLLKTPVASRILNLAITARWARTLGSMIRAGVPMLTALAVSREVTANTIYQEKLGEVSEKVAMGRGLSGPLAATEMFSDMVVQMVNVGEETDRLDEHLDQMAGYYEDELNYRIEQAMSYMEPLVLILVGAGVGFVAISLVSTMYQLADVL